MTPLRNYFYLNGVFQILKIFFYFKLRVLSDFFADLLDIFDGKQVDNLFNSDISIVLSPLPLIPILICYWKPEEGMESSFHLFFDATAEDNLHIESIYTLTAGFVNMFEKISGRHGFR